MSVKDTKIIDLNLFSGSSELFRQSVGGYYYASSVGTLEFLQANSSDILEIERIQRDDIAVRIQDKLLDTRKYANRLYVNKSFDFKSDEHWRKFLIGGSFQQIEYGGIYNSNVYADHYNISALPELARENINTDTEPSILLTTEYYNYYPRYQLEVSNLQSELQLPNFYLLDSASYLVPNYNSEIVQSRYQYSDLKEFLSNSYVNSDKPIDTRLENIFILNDEFEENNGSRLDTADLLEKGAFDSDLSSLYSLMPFGNKLEIKRELTETIHDVPLYPIDKDAFRQIIENYKYKTKFLKLLKEIFQGESGLQPSDINFAINTSTIQSTGVLTGSLETTRTIPIKLVDLPTMLLYAHKNPISETNNITILNSGSYFEKTELDYVFDETGIHRFENTQKSLRVLGEFTNEINSIFSYDFNNRMYPELLLNSAQFTKHYETVAFRIEKIGGTPTGDGRRQNTVQNIWFYNPEGALTYFDTQVKYNNEYTYKIYKYDIVQGYKYQLSDLRTTRQSALTSSGDIDVYCLQFEDALTGIPASGLMALESEIDSLRHRLIPLRIQMEALQLQKELAIDVDAKTNSLKDLLLINSGSDYTIMRRGFKTSGNGWDSYPYAIEEEVISYESVDSPSETEIFLPNPDVILQKIKRGGPDYGATDRPSDFPTTQFQYIYELFYNPTKPNLSEIRIGPPAASPEVRTTITVKDFLRPFKETTEAVIESIEGEIVSLRAIIDPIQAELDLQISARDNLTATADETLITTSYPFLADLNISIAPSVKILEIPIEEKRMRIVDHPPSDFVVTPHHLLDQSNRLAFYCKYDTFSINKVAYPPTITTQDEQNKLAYLTGNDFIEISEQTQESVSRPRFIEVYRTTTKPTSYESFIGSLRKTIDLRQLNGDIPTDHLFVERVRENIKYYYAFRAVSENGVAGQMSPVFQAELINDGGYVYGAFEQFSEDDLAVPSPKEPLLGFKKLLNVIPNIQHLQLDTSTVTFASSSISQMSEINLGTNAQDNLWDPEKYFKIRLTSKKTGKKIDLNIGFEKKERK